MHALLQVAVSQATTGDLYIVECSMQKSNEIDIIIRARVHHLMSTSPFTSCIDVYMCTQAILLVDILRYTRKLESPCGKRHHTVTANCQTMQLLLHHICLSLPHQ